MFIDARKLPQGHVIDTDICIVGSGAAGITMALELLGAQSRVCLLESGGFKFEKTTQSLYEGESVGKDYELDTTRTRYFGGSTNCWGGYCRTIDYFHFGKRDWIPYSGWPITKAALDPYYERAIHLCGIRPEELKKDFWQGVNSQKDIDFLPIDCEELFTRVIKIARDRRKFGLAFRKDIESSENVSVYLYSNAVQVNVGDFGNNIQSIDAKTLSGVEFSVNAKFFIIACGGIENARILLNSNAVKPNGIGNEYDNVGRFFMEHAVIPIGKLANSKSLHRYVVHDPAFAYRRLPIAAEIKVPYQIQEKEQILDSVVHMNPVVGGEDSRGADSTKNVYAMWRTGDYSAEIVKDIAGAVIDPINTLRFCANSLFPSPQSYKYGIFNVTVEPTPNPDSRVTLGADVDQLGVNRVRLNWKPGSLEAKTVAYAKRLMEIELPKNGLGTLEPFSDADNRQARYMHSWCWHHMGTTRMHDDPKQGVVDRNCKVHGISNLFIAGSSVFPTAGYNAPTLTIIALAIRLTEHVEARLQSEAITVTKRATVA